MCHHFWMEEERTPDLCERKKIDYTERKLKTKKETNLSILFRGTTVKMIMGGTFCVTAGVAVS